MGDCRACLSSKQYTCRASYAEYNSYCCQNTTSVNDTAKTFCNADRSQSICSTTAPSKIMQQLTCPYDRGTCQLDSSQIVLSPIKAVSNLDLNNYLFGFYSQCYYQLIVDNSTFQNDYFNYTLTV
jgi:hypothetical protein